VTLCTFSFSFQFDINSWFIGTRYMKFCVLVVWVVVIVQSYVISYRFNVGALCIRNELFPKRK
jgi:hypothetical protein